MNKPTTATYNRLKKFAAASGNIAMIGTVIGSLDEDDIQGALSHMKQKDPDLWKKWGKKYAPPEAEDDDPTADLEDDDDPTANLDDEEPAPPAPRKEVAAPAAPPSDEVQIDGKGYPPKFRLRKPDGTDVDLEVFSKSPKFGFIVRVPVPSDIRTITIAGKPAQVDLLALRRDPDGITEVNGKKVGNSKLIAAAELADL